MSEVLELPKSGNEGDHRRSPLWMVMQEPLLNELVLYLDSVRKKLDDDPTSRVTLKFSRGHLRLVRTAFDAMIRRGEEGLHRLCELFCHTLLKTYQLQSLVIGEVPTSKERFTLVQPISNHDLYSTIDLDLGNRQLKKLKYFDGTEWQAPALVANVVEYQPVESNKFGIHKIISRIKAEEELWNKVVDEIFQLDSLVTRDKQLRHLSHFVKDVFGIKIVVGTPGEASKLQNYLESLRWVDATLSELGIALGDQTDRLDFVETKSYLGTNDRKGSGWEAMKSVVRWNDRTFEIQIQPLTNFWKEREHLTRESHSGFKSRREDLRDQVAKQIPLFGFYRQLLWWLFHDLAGEAPSYPAVDVVVEE